MPCLVFMNNVNHKICGSQNFSIIEEYEVREEFE